MTKWFLGFVLFSAFFCAGCGSEGGKEGDANDPATTTDVEQMQDETDPALNKTKK